ncbi:SLC13 family permease [Oceanimonas marisflavi]|uniref:SLC13 family permease n=1 Tax=Oceanimonas marisflavi TaxID=2059724 RepID=UPI000D303F04|nr:SLC13 family permease [Oceanimonas marisflavi]
MSATLVACVLAGLIATLVFTRIRPLYAFGGAVLIFYFGGLLSKEQLLLNFVNESLLSLFLLLIASLALEKTSLVHDLAGWLLKGSERQVLLKLMSGAGLLSSVTNNTAVVATLMGPVKRSQVMAPSRLLIPLSYAAILGGVLTLVGTSTNLIIDGLARNAGLPGFAFFDFTLVGAPVFVAGMLVLLLCYKLLPENGVSQQSGNANYFTEFRLCAGAPMAGKTVVGAGLRQLESLFLVELVRNGSLISPVKPTEILQAEDRLVFSGNMAEVHKLLALPGLELAHSPSGLLQRNLVEVVLSPSSSLVNRTIRDAAFRSQFDAAVVAVRRGSQRIAGGLGNLTLRPGDVLVLAVGDDFNTRPNIARNFVMVNGMPDNTQSGGWRGTCIVTGFFAALLAAATGMLSLLDAMLLLLLAYVASGVLPASEIRRRASVELVLIIGCALGVAQAMLNSGLANSMATYIVTLFAQWGLWGALVGLYLTTWLLTELITNNAAAALTFPVGLAIAEQYQVDAKPLLLTIAFAASASFLTPYGYQTNLMVYSAGNYRYMDYLRTGFPLAVVYGGMVCGLIQWVCFY